MIFSDEYLDNVKYYTCVQKQFSYGDRMRTVIKLHYKAWWKPRKKIVYKWTIDCNQQHEPKDCLQLKQCLANYFSQK